MKLRMSVVAGLIAEETRRMRPLETQRLCADLYVIQDGFANVFLVNTGDGFIAIDAGINPQNIAREMKILGIEPSAVKAVLITHSDIDHVYGLGAFPAAEVFLPEAELQMLGKYRISMSEQAWADACVRYADFVPAAGENLFGETEFWPEDDCEVVETAQGKTISFLKNRIASSYQLVRDGGRLDFSGTKVDVALIAGHTQGLTSYIVNDKYAFVGDALSLLEGRVEPFNHFLNRDEAQHRTSISKLRDMGGFKYLLTQHYGYTAEIDQAFSSWSA